MNNGGYNAYTQMKVMTADPKKLVMMCYEEAIHCLQMAKAMYASKNYEAKGRALAKALDILNELREALDFEKGGVIAKNLDVLYGFMTKHLLNADRRRDLKALDQVLSMLGELKSAWERAFYSQPDSLAPSPREEYPSAQAPEPLR